MVVAFLCVIGMSTLFIIPFWGLFKVFSPKAVVKLEVRLWTRWFASAVALCAILECMLRLGGCSELADGFLPNVSAYQTWIVDLPIGIAAYVVACNVTPRRRIVLIRKFSSPGVHLFVRHELLPYLAALGRVATLSDKMLDRGETNPIWARIIIEPLAFASHLAFMFLPPCFAFGYLFAFFVDPVPARSLLGDIVAAVPLVAFLVCWLLVLQKLEGIEENSSPLAVAAFAAVARRVRRSIRVTPTSTTSEGHKDLARILSVRYTISPFPPIVAIECDDTSWKVTIESLIRWADIVLLITDKDSDNLNWEHQVARDLFKPVVPINIPCVWACVHNEFAIVLDKHAGK